MTEQEIQIFNDSYERSIAAPGFFDVFYDHFLGSSPEVAAKFQGTDLRRQKNMLRASLYLIMTAIVQKREQLDDLASIARRHGESQLDIRPELYDLWLDSMIHAVRISDPEFEPRTETVWRRAMAKAIDYCVDRYPA